MSTQSGTIAPRRTVELPLWAVGIVALIVIALVAALAVERRTTTTTTTGKAAVAQASFPGALETSGLTRPAAAAVPLVRGSIYTGSTANIREGGALFPATFPGALETSGFAVRTSSAPGGQPIMIGDYACHQCR